MPPLITPPESTLTVKPLVGAPPVKITPEPTSKVARALTLKLNKLSVASVLPPKSSNVPPAKTLALPLPPSSTISVPPLPIVVSAEPPDCKITVPPALIAVDFR